MSTLSRVRLPRGETLRKVWIVASVLYAAARAFAFDAFLGQYGVRGEIYFLVEIATAIPLAHYSAELVKALHHRAPLAKNLIATTIAYILPDIYLLVEAREAPAHIYFTTVGIIAIFAAISIVFLTRKARTSDV